MSVLAKAAAPPFQAETAMDTLADEPGRLAALRAYHVLDTPREPAFDRIVARVAEAFDTPMAAVALLDERRQWFKARVGLQVSQTPRNLSFCDVTIRSEFALAVPDAVLDRRFADNPLVKGPPGIRAYLGAPLRTPEGYQVGALCALDSQPRRFGPDRTEMMTRFAGLIVKELERRKP